ncbi:medium-chain acyl-CoA ligase ACSF2, mitochondrial [Colletes gigas]|uniref:medium-chain acyl-CoA ligase ACSF2, mitochondrial n=1 Tax=Colletes gigas TaxID=935657 RepID=UPI001C9B96C9|nr:medium-chain acyl-CoA ligase ACSF2, mitochondrial [Colletes gigas]XP_043250093.1 medium-chain acyl-CoA ligase ACSF2, mitochondrial [Colletes gigas]XP_043250100.1 medium-chain acyl-CoA ligase ACSF2, mitochondrial [Colletes gigas]XP_043250109.1 medium-chain acyl-CoA ligase ACSF2, mitochondrial [Colletes gigas]
MLRSWINRNSTVLSSASFHVRRKHGSVSKDWLLARSQPWESCGAWMQTKRLNHGNAENLAHIVNGGSTPLLDKTVGKLLAETVERYPNRESLVCIHQNVRLTYSEILRRADRLAAGLRKLGLQPGDRLGLWAPNDVEWFLTFMAAARAGLILVAINSAFQMSELVYCLQKVGVKAVISPDSYRTQNYSRMLLESRRDCPSLEHIIVYSKDHVTGTRRYCDVEELASRSEVEKIAAEQDLISCYDGCSIQFTSGTTGKPKATLLSHRSLVNNTKHITVRADIQKDVKACLNVPLFHAFGISKSLIMLHRGTTVVLESPTFNPVRSLEAIVKEKCEVACGTPTMWINMLAAHQQHQHLPIRLHAGYTGGSSAAPELFRRIRESFRCDDMKTIYGQTEATAVIFQSFRNEERSLTENMVGHVSDHVEVKVVDQNGSTVPYGTPGELWARGYNIMMRYWGDEENTKKTVTEDGWLKTGDQFILHENGYGHIIGRLKDLLIRGGENIFSKEVEDFLMTHPAVLEVHVIGAYDEVYGEEVCACVRLKENARLTKEELRDYCKGKIAHFKIPRYVEFVQDYPRTANGKVQKFLLKEEMERKGTIPATPSTNDDLVSAANRSPR